eukprot:352421-Chlamydomonas_euryale.AAC.23
MRPGAEPPPRLSPAAVSCILQEHGVAVFGSPRVAVDSPTTLAAAPDALGGTQGGGPGPAARDDWLAFDKLGHLLACAAVTALAYMVASRTQAPACIQRYRLYLALAAGITAGIAKEGADFLQLWPGTVSVKDLAADVLGSLLVAAGLFWWEQRTVIKARFVDLELGTVVRNLPSVHDLSVHALSVPDLAFPCFVKGCMNRPLTPAVCCCANPVWQPHQTSSQVLERIHTKQESNKGKFELIVYSTQVQRAPVPLYLSGHTV